MQQLSKSTCVLTIKTQHWLLALVFASIVNIDACIDYQLWHLHWLSTSTITSIIIIDLCTHIPQVAIHHWSCHNPYCSPWIFVIYCWSNRSPWILEFLLCIQIVRCQIPNTSWQRLTVIFFCLNSFFNDLCLRSLRFGNQN